MTPSGLALIILIATLLPVPILAWFDQPRTKTRNH